MKLPQIKIQVIKEWEGGVAEPTRLTRPREIYEAALANWEEGTLEFYECFYVVCLSRNLSVNAFYKISEGGTHGTVVDVSKILMSMIQTISSSVILLHNHPSGNLSPSSQDLDITNKIIAACKIFGYSVLDHLILTSKGYYSFADEGQL